jgi:hypothetical protein
MTSTPSATAWSIAATMSWPEPTDWVWAAFE